MPHLDASALLNDAQGMISLKAVIGPADPDVVPGWTAASFAAAEPAADAPEVPRPAPIAFVPPVEAVA